MVNESLVKMLARKIINQEVNPKTIQSFKIDDIKIQEYRTAVETEIASQ